MARNRGTTEEKIVEAACGLLASGGFAEWGVNRVAEASGFDKVLLYRYFGGLDGLLEVICERVCLFPQVESGGTVAEALEQFARHVRADALVSALLRWSDTVGSEHPLGRAVRRARTVFEGAVAARIGGEDAPLLAAVLVAFALDRARTGMAGLGERELAIIAGAFNLDGAASVVDGGSVAAMAETEELPTELL